jgi:hypothetical protein
VNMVGHKAVSDEGHSVERGVFPQQLQVNRSIRITVEDEAPRISALRDMMCNIQGDYPVESSHDGDNNTRRTARMTPFQIKKPSCFLKLYQNNLPGSLLKQSSTPVWQRNWATKLHRTVHEALETMGLGRQIGHCSVERDGLPRR